jgi:adenylate cyclase class IV
VYKLRKLRKYDEFDVSLDTIEGYGTFLKIVDRVNLIEYGQSVKPLIKRITKERFEEVKTK